MELDDLTLRGKLLQAQKIIDDALLEHDCSHVFGLLSGGHDSLTVTHFAATYLKDKLSGVVHIDTGIGIPETQKFVIDTCDRYGWPLKIYRAVENTQGDGTPDPQVYEDMVVEFGFPGADQHTKMYNRLKERQIRRVQRDHKVHGKRIAFISGVRKHESARRARIKSGECQREGSRVWIAPFFHFTDDEMEYYRRSQELPKNPVKQYLCMSGECLCGAYAKPGELAEIELWYPETGKRIRAIEEKVRAAGFPWGWEEQPPKWWSKMKAAEKAGQADAFESEREDEIQMLCTTCMHKHEAQKK